MPSDPSFFDSSVYDNSSLGHVEDSEIIDTNDKFGKLRSVRCKHPKNIIISYLNINSVRNKLRNLGTLVGNLGDILCISETKLDRSFLTSQFMLVEFKRPYRLDKTSTSEGLLTFIRNDIPSRQLTGFHFLNGIQILPIELNLKRQNG